METAAKTKMTYESKLKDVTLHNDVADKMLKDIIIKKQVQNQHLSNFKVVIRQLYEEKFSDQFLFFFSEIISERKRS